MKPLPLSFLATLAGMSFLTIAGCRSSRAGSGSDVSPAPDPGTNAWQRQPLTIDGSDKDWTKPLPGFIREENVAYSVTNDGQNLYILVSTKNPQEQQKIIQGGLTVWINNKGEKNNGDAVGIGYPLDTRNDRDHNLMAEAQPQRYKNDKPTTLEDKKEYALYGFSQDSIGNYTYGDSNPQGITMRLDYNDAGELIYEAAVPLKDIYPQHNTSSSYASKTVAVGIFIEGLPPNANVPRPSRGGGGPSIGVGGGMGFGSFGSGGGLGLSIGTGSLIGGGNSRNKTRQLYDQTRIWHVAGLAGR